MVGLGQAETAHHLTGRQFWQGAFFQGFLAEGMDGVHHQRGLYAQCRTVGGIHPFHFPGNQAVADVVQARATILFRQGGAQHAQLAHLVEDVPVELLMPVGLDDARHQPLLAEAADAVADLTLGIVQLRVETQQIIPGCGSHLYSPESDYRDNSIMGIPEQAVLIAH